MELNVLANDTEVVCVQCTGQITQNDVPARREPMQALLGWEAYSRKVLLNMERTTYIDSSGVSWLLTCHKQFLQAGGKLVLHSVPPIVSQVLRLLKLQVVLNIANDEASARSLAGGSKS